MGAWIETRKIVDYSRSPPVASYVGAWIETLMKSRRFGKASVASYVGAWIETRFRWCCRCSCGSHPMWVRGLKLVVPYGTPGGDGSHPMWVRGLKLR